MPPAALNWYHLADSAFPTGGFAFSSGIEAAAKLGVFSCTQSFTNFLRAALQQLAGYEIPFLNSCFRHPDPADILQRYHAGMTAPSLCRASLVQGRGLLRSLAQILGPDAIPRTRARLPHSPDHRHLLLAFGFSLHELGMDLHEARRCLLYINLRDWISSAIRLGSIGPMAAHHIQHLLLREGDALLASSDPLDHLSARRNAPALEIAQSWHDHIYSKLFQS